jgi:hypothetical protein
MSHPDRGAMCPDTGRVVADSSQERNHAPRAGQQAGPCRAAEARPGTKKIALYTDVATARATVTKGSLGTADSRASTEAVGS